MKSIEIFAGAGGLAIGADKAGFTPELVVEWARNCRATIEYNRVMGDKVLEGWPNNLLSDVRDVDFSRYEGSIDFVSGGPPCQPFSNGGKHRAQADSRDMFPEAVRAIREVRPKAFLFENVKGLTRTAFRNYFEYITLQLRHPYLEAKCGEDWSDHYLRLQRHHTSHSDTSEDYRLVTQVLNAADYGVPQKRERIFFVGFRADTNVEWSFPKPTHSFDALVWDQRSDGHYLDKHEILKKSLSRSLRFNNREKHIDLKPKTKPWITVRDAISDLPNPRSIEADRFLNHQFQGGAKAYPGHTGSPFDEPAKTLKAGVHGVPGGENMVRYINGKVRYFSVRESARLQTFPDNYEITGSWSEAMRQLGNAVPVELARIISTDIRRKLIEEH